MIKQYWHECVKQIFKKNTSLAHKCINKARKWHFNSNRVFQHYITLSKQDFLNSERFAINLKM